MIRSRRNETIKAIRGLRRKQGDHVLLEGPHLIEAALDAGLRIESLLLTPELAASAEGRRIAARWARPALEVESGLLDPLADADSPRGALAVARLPRGGAESAPLDPRGLYLYLDGIQEPGNLGAIARVGAAFGATALLLSPGCAHPNHPRALRASAGSLLTLPVARDAARAAVEARLSSLSPAWAGLDAHGGEPLPDRRPAGAWILALGAEGRGFSSEIAARLDRRWTIPIAPGVESLNVAVAAGVALHALAARR